MGGVRRWERWALAPAYEGYARTGERLRTARESSRRGSRSLGCATTADCDGAAQALPGRVRDRVAAKVHDTAPARLSGVSNDVVNELWMARAVGVEVELAHNVNAEYVAGCVLAGAAHDTHLCVR